MFQGEEVPAEEKLISLFKPHTEIIIKDRRDTQFGHKVFLTGGKSSLILDCLVVEGNPRDAGMALELMDRQVSTLLRGLRVRHATCFMAWHQ